MVVNVGPHTQSGPTGLRTPMTHIRPARGEQRDHLGMVETDRIESEHDELLAARDRLREVSDVSGWAA